MFQLIDKYGYPIESVEGRYVQNFIRKLLLTRGIKRNRGKRE